VSVSPAQFFLGFFAAIGLFNGLLYCVTRDRPFAWYAGAMGSMIAIQLLFPPFGAGLADAFGPGGFAVYRVAALIAYYICLVAFARAFLEVRRRFPELDRILVILLAANVLGIALESWLPSTVWHDVLDDILNFGLLAACIVAGIRTARAGESSAKYFIIAFVGAVVGIALNDLNGRFHWAYWVNYALQAGVAWEALFLALALADRLQYALIDQLTGVANRRAFDASLERAWQNAQHGSGSFAVLMIDIDDFKAYNDRCGHPAGDALLRDVARAARAATRTGVDSFARYGGEEFVAILPGADVRAATAIAERLCNDVRRLTVATVSVGYALSLRADLSPHAVVARADAALYAAKAAGKDRSSGDPASCATMTPS
jgi:diguanylate cyclase (GGDEF)-like protein